MARGFIPSRSALYGASEQQALAGVAQTVRGALLQWDDDDWRTAYAKETSSAQVALIGALDALKADLYENHGNEPDTWTKIAKQKKGEISKAVLEGIRLPKAKRAAELQLNKDFARFQAGLNAKSRARNLKNALGNIEVARRRLKEESREYRTVADAVVHAKQHNEVLAANAGLVGEEQTAFNMREDTREILDDGMHQEALRSGDESVFERANEYAEMALGKLEQPLYGPEQMGEMRKRYKKAEDAAKAEADTLKAEQANAEEAEITNALLTGQLTAPDGRTYNDVIVRSEFLSPEKKRTLSNLWDKVTAGTKSDKDKYLAWKEVNDLVMARDYTGAREKLAENAAAMGSAWARDLTKEIQEADAGIDPNFAVNTLLSDMINGVRQLQLGEAGVPELSEGGKPNEIYSSKEMAAHAADRVRIETQLGQEEKQIRDILKQHPDWTPGQQIEQVRQMITPLQEETAARIVEGAGFWSRFFTPRLRPVQTGALLGAKALLSEGEFKPLFVKMRAPDGRVMRVPQKQVAEATKRGWKEVP